MIFFLFSAGSAKADLSFGIISAVKRALKFYATATPTVPPAPTATFTYTVSATATDSPTATPTNSPANTATLSPTETATDSPSNTPTNSLTETPTNSATDSPTLTFTQTATNTPTNSPTITSTNTPTNSATNSSTTTPTNTPTDTPTVTPTMTSTNSPTTTPTDSPSNTPTNSPTDTLTDTPTDTPTESPTATPTDTPTNSATPTPTDTYTNTATATPTQTSDCVGAPFSVGDLTNNNGSSGIGAFAAKVVMVNGGWIKQIRLNGNGGSNCTLYGAVYQDNGFGTKPGNRMFLTGPYTMGPNQAVTLDIPDTHVPPGIYWVGFSFSGVFPIEYPDSPLTTMYLGTTLPTNGSGASSFPFGCPAALDYCSIDPTVTPTDSPSPTPSPTASNTATESPSDTSTATPSDTPSNTPTATSTDSPSDTPTPTSTDTATETPTDTVTETPTETPTNTITHTPTDTPTVTPTGCAGAPGFFGTDSNSSSVGTCLPIASKYTLVNDAQVYQLEVYTTPQSHCRYAIYGDGGSGPSTLIAETGDVSTNWYWNTLPIPRTYLTAGNYWLVMLYGGAFYQGSSGIPTIQKNYVYGVDCVGIPTTAPQDFSGSTFSGSDFTLEIKADYISCANTPTPTITSTPSITNTPTDSPTVTDSPTPSPTDTLSPTVTNTPCAAPVTYGQLTQNQNETSTMDTMIGNSVLINTTGNAIRLGVNLAFTPSNNVKMALFSNKNGLPGEPDQMLSVSPSFVPLSGSGWNQVEIPDVPVTAGTYYWILLLQTGGPPNSNGNILYYQTSSVPTEKVWYNQTDIPAIVPAANGNIPFRYYNLQVEVCP